MSGRVKEALFELFSDFISSPDQPRKRQFSISLYVANFFVDTSIQGEDTRSYQGRPGRKRQGGRDGRTGTFCVNNLAQSPLRPEGLK